MKFKWNIHIIRIRLKSIEKLKIGCKILKQKINSVMEKKANSRKKIKDKWKESNIKSLKKNLRKNNKAQSNKRILRSKSQIIVNQ